MLPWLLTLLPILVVITASVATTYALRPRIRRLWADTGWNQWRRTAKTLRWRDRWRIYWATVIGRGVRDTRLAGLAARRAEYVVAVIHHQLHHGVLLGRWPWLSIAVALGLVGAGLLGIGLVEGELLVLVAGPSMLAAGIFYAFFPHLQVRGLKRAMARARRSIEANRSRDSE